MSFWKKQVVFLFLFVFVCFLFIFVVNYTADPLWFFEYSNILNEKRYGFEELQQKTNSIKTVINTIDSILLGSSTARHVPAYAFENTKVFNYACPSLRSGQFIDIMNYIMELRSKNKKNIKFFIALNMMENNIDINKIDIISMYYPFKYYIQNSSYSNMLKQYLSINLLKKSIEVFQLNLSYKTNFFAIPYPIYTMTANSPIMLDEASDLTEDSYNNKKNRMTDLMIAGMKSYNNFNLIKIKEKITKEKIECIFFIPPVTKDFFDEIIKVGMYDVYENIIRDMVNVFGEVWNFMYVNSVTFNFHNHFYDTIHSDTVVGNFIAQKITGGKNSPSDFGVLLTKKNIDEFLEFAKIKLQTLPKK